ncbi:hypothetical protein XAC902_720079 [Xanthomonas citri pv. citri]|nr:hypothetical protein XAC902_720079 [Xanthomonas citri pv. citri]CEH80989.1 hypothetical protein XACS582_8860006 [Xanthomonas citri pv. citri]
MNVQWQREQVAAVFQNQSLQWRTAAENRRIPAQRGAAPQIKLLQLWQLMDGRAKGGQRRVAYL